MVVELYIMFLASLIKIIESRVVKYHVYKYLHDHNCLTPGFILAEHASIVLVSDTYWVELVGFNVGLELCSGLLPTVWDSSLRIV